MPSTDSSPGNLLTGILWIHWSTCSGITDRHGMESLVAIRRNMHIDLPEQQIVCGIIVGQHWMSDEFIARMAQIRGLDSAITEDHRWSRSGGPAIECRIVGMSGPHVRHSLPRQALSALSPVRLCSQDEMISFTAHGWHYLSYLIAGAVEPAIADVLAAHIQDVCSLLQDGGHQWVDGATRFLIRSMANRPDDLGLILQAIAERSQNE